MPKLESYAEDISSYGLSKKQSQKYITQDNVNGILVEYRMDGVADILSNLTYVTFISKTRIYSISYYGDHTQKYRDIFKVFLSTISFLK
jgi:hypothetical protein